MTDLEFLRAVRERLRTHGWIKGWLGNPEGPHCVLGAAVNVTGGKLCKRREYISFFEGPARILREQVIGFNTSIGTWNDSRTEAEVFAALDDAIARLEEMESGTTPEAKPEPVLA